MTGRVDLQTDIHFQLNHNHTHIHMKKLILLILIFVAFQVKAQQQNYWPSAIAPGSTSFSPSFRWITGVTDSLNDFTLAIGTKSYRFYSSARMTQLFAPNTGGGYVPNSRTLTLNGTTQDLSVSRTFNINLNNSLTFSNGGAGDPAGSIFNGATGKVISYNSIGALSGNGTSNFIPKYTGSSTQGNSRITDNGTTFSFKGGSDASNIFNISTSDFVQGSTGSLFKIDFTGPTGNVDALIKNNSAGNIVTGASIRLGSGANSNITLQNNGTGKIFMGQAGYDTVSTDNTVVLIRRGLGTAIDYNFYSAHGIREESSLTAHTNANPSAYSYAFLDIKTKVTSADVGNVDHIAGGQARMEVYNSGHLNYWYGWMTEPLIQNGTTEEVHGLEIRDILKLGGSPTIKKHVGVYVHDLSVANNNYALFGEGAGKIHLADTTSSNTDSTSSIGTRGGIYAAKVIRGRAGAVFDDLVSIKSPGPNSLFLLNNTNIVGGSPVNLNFGVDNTATIANYSAQISAEQTNTYGASLLFKTFDNTARAERMRLTHDGNLFIGYTADPTSGNKLAVNGNGYFNGALTSTSFIKSGATTTNYLQAGGADRTAAQVLSDIGAQAALTLTTTGSTGASTLSGGTLNIPQYATSNLLTSFYTDVASTTSAADAYSYTVAANALTTNGQYLDCVYTALQTGGAINTIIITFGGQTVYNNSANNLLTGTDPVGFKILRSGTTTARCQIYYLTTSGSVAYSTQDLTGVDFTTTNIIKASISSATAGTLTMKSGTITIYK
jgi:hypothetical protein